MNTEHILLIVGGVALGYAFRWIGGESLVKKAVRKIYEKFTR